MSIAGHQSATYFLLCFTCRFVH